MIAVEALPALSKLVSYALRHRPREFELELDAQGWVPVEQLLDALRTHPGEMVLCRHVPPTFISVLGRPATDELAARTDS